MALTNSKSSASKKQKLNSEREIQKLRRMDLLELLLDEMRQNERNSAELEALTELTERLKGKLDDKDAQIERLKSKLDAKDAEIARLEELNHNVAKKAGTIDMKALLDVEREAVEQYLANLNPDDESSSE